MLTEILQDVGLHRDGDDLDLAKMLEPFSRWGTEQTIEEEDRFYLASRLGAFIYEFLIDNHSAERRIEGTHILMRMPLADSEARDFDPYVVALGVADGKVTLAEFLFTLTASNGSAAQQADLLEPFTRWSASVFAFSYGATCHGSLQNRDSSLTSSWRSFQSLT